MFNWTQRCRYWYTIFTQLIPNTIYIGAWFSQDGDTIYTVSRDGSVFEWANVKSNQHDEQVQTMPRKKTKVHPQKSTPPPIMNWRPKNKHFFMQNNAKVICAEFHPPTGLLSVGFDSGVFGIWEMPDFAHIQSLRYP